MNISEILVLESSNLLLLISVVIGLVMLVRLKPNIQWLCVPFVTLISP
jgi:hypothetical protein